jgi:predicted MPP superfamily phosphohydrolase
MSDFKVTRHRVRISDEQRSLRRPFTAVLISDLHNVSYGENNERLLQEIRNENPELILIAGDLITAGKQVQTDVAVSLLDQLTRSYPVYYANGNHEHRMKLNQEKYGDAYERYSNRIKSFGVHLLENTGTQITLKERRFKIWGLELPGEYFARGRKNILTVETLTELLGVPEPDCYHILLAHHPMYGEVYAEWGADLALSGHLHGGIVRLPFLGGVISPQMQLFPKYDRGLYKIGDKRLIVSAGLGSHTIPLRLNNPPELIVIDFI